MKRISGSGFTGLKAGCRKLCFATMLLAGGADAATLDITMQFKADIYAPAENEFKNTTPVSGYCMYYPINCAKGEFSILIPGLSAVKTFEKASPEIKNHTYIAIDGRIKHVTLTNTKTGETTTAEFRWAFIGMTYNRLSSWQNIIDAMNGSGYFIKGDCSGRRGMFGDNFYDIAWSIYEKQAVCYRRLNYDSADGKIKVKDFSIGYVIKTPKPLELPAGEYEGEVVYTVGDGMDVDVGAQSYSDNEVRIRIRATVEHAFYLHFPRGSENVQLSPPDGWSAWINGGMIPQRLSREVPFTLTSSGSFKVSMQCQYAAGQGCGLQNPASGETVPLDVRMTVPGLTSGRQPVHNMLLNTDTAGQIIDNSGWFAVDLRSKLDFVVNRPEVEKMVKAPGSDWKGVVTLIFDSDVR
ncbi:hypothetical protein AAGR22_05415 [Erwinia sp. HDF1-3R]|uniref:hypothetical protein n=1 Tax=Erwinia sp. HDF1-3R TaxID=3141543 RepID=UPI0031F4F9BA